MHRGRMLAAFLIERGVVEPCGGRLLVAGHDRGGELAGRLGGAHLALARRAVGRDESGIGLVAERGGTGAEHLIVVLVEESHHVAAESRGAAQARGAGRLQLADPCLKRPERGDLTALLVGLAATRRRGNVTIDDARRQLAEAVGDRSFALERGLVGGHEAGGLGLGATLRTSTLSDPVSPCASVTVRVRRWLPGLRLITVSCAPDPSAPSRLDVHVGLTAPSAGGKMPESAVRLQRIRNQQVRGSNPRASFLHLSSRKAFEFTSRMT
jgi:hypothetical protein